MTFNPPTSLPLAARTYAEFGFPVFLLAPRTKVPMAGSHGFKDATADPEKVTELWRMNPECNIGLPTNGLLVIDVDGSKNAWPGDSALLSDLKKAPWASTPGGGTQFLFRQPAGKNWRGSQSELAPKVDVRANGGYIAVAPSIRCEGPYFWHREPIFPASSLCEPPRWLIEPLDNLTYRTTTAKATAKAKYKTEDTQDNICPVPFSLVPNGRRQTNERLFDLARFVLGAGCNPEVAIQEWIRRTPSKYLTRPHAYYKKKFYAALKLVLYPQGTGPVIERTIELAQVDNQALFPEITNPTKRLLIRTCMELQRHHGAAPFFLSCHMAGRVLGVVHSYAHQMLGDLIAAGILKISWAGKPGNPRATRYFYLGPLAPMEPP